MVVLQPFFPWPGRPGREPSSAASRDVTGCEVVPVMAVIRCLSAGLNLPRLCMVSAGFRLRQPRTGMTVCRETLASVSCAERDLRVLYSAGVVLKCRYVVRQG